MLKILYAADNRKSSYYNLKRFLDTFSSEYEIKVAAYTKSIGDLNANWNLDALLDFTGKRQGISFQNDNFQFYINEVKSFAPDLIISDLEIYTSYIGLSLGITVWQVSPLLLLYALKNKKKDRTQLYKYHSGLISKDSNRVKYLNFIINNSDERLVLSHLGDTTGCPVLVDKFAWVRPSIEFKSKQSDSVSTGSALDLADNYYNEIHSVIEPDYSDPECILYSYYNSKIGDVQLNINDNVRFLSQYLTNFKASIL